MPKMTILDGVHVQSGYKACCDASSSIGVGLPDCRSEHVEQAKVIEAPESVILCGGCGRSSHPGPHNPR